MGQIAKLWGHLSGSAVSRLTQPPGASSFSERCPPSYCLDADVNVDPVPLSPFWEMRQISVPYVWLFTVGKICLILQETWDYELKLYIFNITLQCVGSGGILPDAFQAQRQSRLPAYLGSAPRILCRDIWWVLVLCKALIFIMWIMVFFYDSAKSSEFPCLFNSVNKYSLRTS